MNTTYLTFLFSLPPINQRLKTNLSNPSFTFFFFLGDSLFLYYYCLLMVYVFNQLSNVQIDLTIQNFISVLDYNRKHREQNN